MKMIVAYVKPFKMDAVRQALAEAGAEGLTISEVRGFGRQKGKLEIYRGAEYEVPLIPKIKIEAVMPAAAVKGALVAIQEAAATGSIGDGKIFVLDVASAIRIRTGETGLAAL
ncbi:P-II family nitrogen regulator [Caulobacter endophyticus]|uniref:P-II family nitrogen regulator n=1 Tax=Caulobacter endophyticus TaxID=2172652 RepID=UPI002410708B|nr:P-II family nitrogen regulator [Caulobacter endophyticus]MDG2531564.1 P-II family nitrogen regulator [Caulobacter endophyticus]